MKTTLEKEPELRYPAMWTPWGQVICYRCHGPEFPRATMGEREFAEHTSLQPARAGEAGGVCDKCIEEIWIREDIAWLQEIQREIGVGELLQTGGGCAALQITRGGFSDEILFVTALDGPLMIGAYESEESLYGEGLYTDCVELEEGDVKGAIEAIKRMAPEYFCSCPVVSPFTCGWCR